MSSRTAYQVCVLLLFVSIFRGISGVTEKVLYQGAEYEVESTCRDETEVAWCYSSVNGWTKCGDQTTADSLNLPESCSPEPCLPEFTYGGVTYKNSCTCDDHVTSWCYQASGWKNCGIMETIQGMSNVVSQCPWWDCKRTQRFTKFSCNLSLSCYYDTSIIRQQIIKYKTFF
jgi:hypothetical protein